MNNRRLYTVTSTIVGAILMYYLYFLIKSIHGFSGRFFNLELQWYLINLRTILGLTGLIIMLATRFEKTSAFRLYCCFMILNFPISLWYFIKVFSDQRHFPETGWIYFGVALFLILTACCCTMLYMLTKERRVKFNYTTFAGEIFAEFAPANRWKRFVHYLSDTLMLLYFCYNFAKIIIYFLSFNEYDRHSFLSSQFGAQLFTVFIFFLYYLVFEAIFKTTAGKCLTNTIIVNERGERAGTGQLIGRTFCRFIPFDPLSFFARSRRGWHDTITHTYVVDSVLREEKQEEEKDIRDILSQEDTANYSPE